MSVTITPDTTTSQHTTTIAAGTNAPALGAAPAFGVSATLAANEYLATRLRRGEPVLRMAFGEAGLDVHPLLAQALAAAAGRNEYGPVAGSAGLRAAAAGYWHRRGLDTDAENVVAGPGSKALLFGLVSAIGGDIALTRPSWVSYAAQASLAAAHAHLVPGRGGVPDALRLARTVVAARALGHPVRAVVVTLPDNPTGLLATMDAVRGLCAVAERYDLVIISDEIYRDLVFDEKATFPSPACLAPHRTVITTGLSKNLALGGWRIGVARLPAGPLGRELRRRLLAIGSEIWSAAAAPVQHAAAVAFGEPDELTAHVSRSRRLHAAVARAVAERFTQRGVPAPAPQGGFYVYPDFSPFAAALRDRHGIGDDAGLADVLLRRFGVGTLPGSAFGEEPRRLRLRVTTSMLYGDTPAQRTAALEAAAPGTTAGRAADAAIRLPWIGAALDRLTEVLTGLLA